MPSKYSISLIFLVNSCISLLRSLELCLDGTGVNLNPLLRTCISLFVSIRLEMLIILIFFSSPLVFAMTILVVSDNNDRIPPPQTAEGGTTTPRTIIPNPQPQTNEWQILHPRRNALNRPTRNIPQTTSAIPRNGNPNTAARNNQPNQFKNNTHQPRAGFSRNSQNNKKNKEQHYNRQYCKYPKATKQRWLEQWTAVFLGQTQRPPIYP